MEADHRAAKGVLQSYSAFFNQALANRQQLDLPSLDHQIALQFRSLVRLAAMDILAEEDDDESLCLALGLIESDLRSVDELNLLSTSNHGVMLATSIMHVTALLSPVISDEFGCVLARARETLVSAFHTSIDEEGVVNENTPSYQAYWIVLAEEVARIGEFGGTGLSGSEVASFAESATRVRTAFSHMLLPDGSVPPIGDSVGGRQVGVMPTVGSWVSPRNGIATQTSERTFLSMTCGCSGVVHKQLDDTAITYWADGNWWILDGGLISYERTDREAVRIRSQRGHSGAFFESLDEVDAIGVVRFKTKDRSIHARMVVGDVRDGFEVGGSVLLPGNRAVSRTLCSLSPESFMLTDEFLADADEPCVSRFIFPPNTRVRWMDDELVLEQPERAGEARLAIKRQAGWTDASLKIGPTVVVFEGSVHRDALCVSIEPSWNGGMAINNLRISYTRGD